MSNRKYDPALKEEILTAVQVHGVSVKKAAQDFSVPAHSIYSWIKEKRYAGKTYSVWHICKVLKVSRQGFYQRLKAPLVATAGVQQDERELVEQAHACAAGQIGNCGFYRLLQACEAR
jgi:transposase-like protein